jgi:branched-chain amino acid aminotransferase
MAEKVFLNNKLIDIEKAHISATDSGFLYGAGLFETMRSFNGVVFALEDHMERLFSSAVALSINNPYDKKYLTDSIYAVLKANKLTDARLRLTLTNGPMAETEEQRKATLLITATKLQPYPAEYYKKGVMVILSPSRQNTFEPTCGHKTTSYFSRMITLNSAHQKRAAEALWFTTENLLAEGSISNVFLVKDSVIYTPAIETPVLAGIARKSVCQIAETNSIKLVEKDLNINDLLGADEIFLTNVIMQIMPITRVEKYSVGDSQVGTITKRLQKSFEEFVKSQCKKNK